MRPMHRARQVSAYHESEFKRRIPTLLKKQVIRVADKQFGYDGHAVHTRFVLPNFEASGHVAFILRTVIAQVGHLHPAYRSVSLLCGPFGASHTRIDLEVRLQNHKVGVLSGLARFLVCLGWDIVPMPIDDVAPDRRASLPHAVHLFDLKTHRCRLAMHACEYSSNLGSAWIDTGKHHVHVNLVVRS